MKFSLILLSIIFAITMPLNVEAKNDYQKLAGDWQMLISIDSLSSKLVTMTISHIRSEYMFSNKKEIVLFDYVLSGLTDEGTFSSQGFIQGRNLYFALNSGTDKLYAIRLEKDLNSGEYLSLAIEINSGSIANQKSSGTFTRVQ